MAVRAGGKMRGTHTTFSDLGATVADIADTVPEVIGISGGILKSGDAVRSFVLCYSHLRLLPQEEVDVDPQTHLRKIEVLPLREVTAMALRNHGGPTRQTAVALLFCRDTGDFGLQRTTKAVEAGDQNWSFLQGKVEPGENCIAAILREVREEYAPRRVCTSRTEYLVSTEVGIRKGSAKEIKYQAEFLHWCVLFTGPSIPLVQEGSVADFRWFKTPDEVIVALGSMRPEKVCASMVAMARLHEMNPDLTKRFLPVFDSVREKVARAA